MTVEQALDANPYDKETHGTLENYYQHISNLLGNRVGAGSIGSMYRTMRRQREWVTTRKMTNANGGIIHEVKVAVPQDEIQDKSQFEPVALTSNPYGGQWVKYAKKDFVLI